MFARLSRPKRIIKQTLHTPVAYYCAAVSTNSKACAQTKTTFNQMTSVITISLQHQRRRSLSELSRLISGIVLLVCTSLFDRRRNVHGVSEPASTFLAVFCQKIVLSKACTLESVLKRLCIQERWRLQPVVEENGRGHNWSVCVCCQDQCLVCTRYSVKIFTPFQTVSSYLN